MFSGNTGKGDRRNEKSQDENKRHVKIVDNKKEKPKKKIVRPLTAEERALKQKVSEINSTTRWLADSAFTTYFGKPAFHAYGKGNTNPTSLTQKFLTHSINPNSGTWKKEAEYA
jgi:glutamate/tyrosine decarboxylase-like PLP-dependent enzyme